jgi:hypothetical protein
MAYTINQLDETYPDGSVHKVYVLDDDLKGIKRALKETFPNITAAVTASHTELNYLDGVTGPIQAQLDALSSRINDVTARGTIYAGRIALNGSGTQLPAGWSSVRDATGVYTVTHTTMSNHTVDLIIDASSTTDYWKYNAFAGSLQTSSFGVNVVDVTSGAAADAGFYFHLHSAPN